MGQLKNPGGFRNPLTEGLQVEVPTTGDDEFYGHATGTNAYNRLIGTGGLHSGAESVNDYVNEIGIYPVADPASMPSATWGQFGDGRMFWGDGSLAAYYGDVTLSHDRDGSLTIQGVNAKTDESTSEADTRLRILQRPDGTQSTAPFVIGNTDGTGDSVTVEADGSIHMVVPGFFWARAADYSTYTLLGGEGIISVATSLPDGEAVLGFARVGEALNRWQVSPLGTISAGDGVGGVDVSLGRQSADTWGTPDDFEITATARGVILRSPDNTRYRIKVANGGALSTVAA